MKTLLVVLLVACTWLAPRLADACGTWGMDDAEKKWHVEWWINAGLIGSAKGKVGHLGLAERKDGLYVFKNDKPLYDLAGNKLRKLGKQVAVFDDSTISFGKRVYTFTFEDGGNVHDKIPSWNVTVKRGDVVVLEAKQAWALCAGMGRSGQPLPEADQKFEIRRRMMFYLAWREVGA